MSKSYPCRRRQQCSRMRTCSSRQLTAALERLGCYPGKSGRSNHQTYRRRRPDGSVVAASIVLGKRELQRGTVRDILWRLQISEADFDRALR